jgi:glycosyltransferase involved in cell wall biosynthesis
MASLIPGMHGGIEQAVTGLVASLGHLTDGDEQYVVITDPAAPDWLDAHLGRNTRRVAGGSEGPRRRHLKRALQPLLPVFRTARSISMRLAPSEGLNGWALASFNPTVEQEMPDVVHFPYQWMHRTTAPSIFNPWDLQHVHFPEFFDPQSLSFRSTMYPLWCARCSRIEVASRAVKRDLVENMRVPEEKVMVVPRASPLSVVGPVKASDVKTVRRKYSLPPVFGYYPAHTWPHKNHLRLFEALALMRDRDEMPLHLVGTGMQTEYWSVLKEAILDFGLSEQVKFLGFVPDEDIRCLYRAAAFTVFPTLFEGAGLPLLEALSEGCPLLCSNLPVLVEQAGNAALLFDPLSSEDMARAMRRILTEPGLRERMITSGLDTVSRVSLDGMARTYRAAYRQLSGRHLSPDDQDLIRIAFGIDGTEKNVVCN